MEILPGTNTASLTWEMPVCKIFTGGVEVIFQFFFFFSTSQLTLLSQRVNQYGSSFLS